MGPQAGDVQSGNRRAHLLQNHGIQLPEGNVGMSGAGTASPARCTRHSLEPEAELSDRSVWRGHSSGNVPDVAQQYPRRRQVLKDLTLTMGDSTGLPDICKGIVEGATNPSGSLGAVGSFRSDKECHRKVQFHEIRQSGDLQLEQPQDKTGEGDLQKILSNFQNQIPGAQHREDVELLERAQRRQQEEQRDGAALLGAKTGRAGIVQPGQEKLWAELRVALQGLKEPQESWRETIPKEWRDTGHREWLPSARGQGWMGS
ncbi:hypothetical protein DUI87_15566 [Hirundo rustica rustica]|uniref:Uncharacterized protein n=1 Tax=Hirundo rustica rustica TaxID=333673 RepID=A0A3M0JYT3_HIRRU|nr:hypothetical protein DUI87_15566 [Hirundo rustica rustica]